MNKQLLLVFFLCCLAFLGCREDHEGNMARIATLRDTVLNSFSTVNGVAIEVKDDRQLNVALIGATVEAASDADKQQIADKVGDMAEAVFTGHQLEKGRVVFSPTDVADMDAAMNGKTFDMHLAQKQQNSH